MARFALAALCMTVACSKADAPKTDKVDRAPPRGAGRFEKLVAEATAIRDAACACRETRCFREITETQWKPFENRNQAALNGLARDEIDTMWALMDEILSGCERKANTVVMTSVRVVNECFMQGPASPPLVFHVVMDGETPHDDGTRTKSRFYTASCVVTAARVAACGQSCRPSPTAATKSKTRVRWQ